ncbi:hypothetical protein [Micromonospora cathayae]|uniref:Uncharacterized protein n=1 Tax=Micromonospora cathayae TaxID=3028804 RepID=A0ABY7ZVK4_9ACTN|nr:hypothetical protein [Micromonospora sp. HUAS 3]WDZ86063.1 hypothetical protein PVK37_06455 [Micromonospora sp. HUAS 3]
MTPHNELPSPSGERTPHRLTSPDQLTGQLTERWGDDAVAAYTLAARALAEKHPEVGRVDTWRRLVLKIMRDRARVQNQTTRRHNPPDKVSQRRMRKKLSWHFTRRSRGPAWQQVTLLVRHLVPVEQQPATLARLAALHAAARGYHPVEAVPDIVPAHAAPDPRPAPAVDPAGTGSPETALIELLRRQKAQLEQELATSRAENRQLRDLLDRSWRTDRASGTDRADDRTDRTGRTDQADEIGRTDPTGGTDRAGPPVTGPGGLGGPGDPAPAPRTARNSGHFPGPAEPDESVRDRSRNPPPRVDLATPRRSGPGGAETHLWIEGLWHGALRAAPEQVDGSAPAAPPGATPNRSADRFPPLAGDTARRRTPPTGRMPTRPSF